MRLKELRVKEFKRFSDLTVTGIPETARLIVLAGPNGVGKSSFFDALRTWHWQNGAAGFSWDQSYYAKAHSFDEPVDQNLINQAQQVALSVYDELDNSEDGRKKRVYVRTAFRHEPDFSLVGFSRLDSPLNTVRITKLIDNDASVSENYQRLILATLNGVFSEEIADDTTKGELRSRIIGRVADAMQRVFPDLVLTGVGDPMMQGSFFFRKGSANNFLYKNVSAGEKAVFDLLLDMIIKREYFNNTLWCIDEPETHLNTRIQGDLLGELFNQIPEHSQLIIATHSIGFMAKARELDKAHPGSVAFLDFGGHNFDTPVVMQPVTLDRSFWLKTLDVALGDLAKLIAPEQIVLCEGRYVKPGESNARGEFDAKCYRAIFGKDYPNTDFISVGNSEDVSRDKIKLGQSIQAIVSGTTVIRVIDRDYLNDEEVEEKTASGIRVLSRRNIESFLLDDEMLTALCAHVGKEESVTEVIKIRDDALAASIARNNDVDDLKSAAGECYVNIKRLLQLTRSGSGWESFATGTLAPLMTREMAVYRELESAIFGSSS